MMQKKVQYSGSRMKYSVLIIILIAFHLLMPNHIYAKTKFTLLLTSNLQGRFSPEKENQNGNDPMLLLGQSILKEREKSRFDIYLDLGNAFYPGVLSRYSYGSVMMDFFNYFDCTATLISSRDISIGLSNLEFLSKGKATKMLSANIIKDNQPVFTPYIVVNHSDKKIGIIGVSSAEGLFDIAEKKTLNISFSEYRESIKARAVKLKEEGCSNMILLSGLSYRNNIELMKDIPEVDLIISGGDSTGGLFSIPSSRVDLQWGRSIVTLLENDGYYRLELDLGEGIGVTAMDFTKPSENKILSPAYSEFAGRLSLWKDKFREEERHLVAEKIPEASVTDETAANMLRHRYNSEIGIIEQNSISPHIFGGSLFYSTLMTLVNNDYPIFTYRISGADLKKIIENSTGLIITGIKKGKVQDYVLSDKQMYRICSTQYAFDRISGILRKHIEYKNTWKTLQDEIEEDMQTDMSLVSENFDYLEDRFRMLADITLSNFYDNSVVKRGENIDTPPGKPEMTYRRWGMEDTVNITLYNRNHQLVLTPYIYFIKQNEEYLQNLLRGTLLYTYSPNSPVRPYHKSQLDTVLVEVEGRPVLARETVGISIKTELITGRLGAGFEKQIQDPETSRVDGIEALLDVNFPFTGELTYTLKLDSFISVSRDNSEDLKLRTDITNAISYKLNGMLGVSLKYKWFYLYSKEIEETYKSTQTLVSIDLKTDFKLF